MKVCKMVRGQLLLAGLALALLLTPAAHSQEITNATFDDGPNVTTFPQYDVALPVAQAVPASQNDLQPVQSSLASPRAALIESPWVAASFTVILFLTIALSVVGGPKRTRRYTSYPRA